LKNINTDRFDGNEGRRGYINKGPYRNIINIALNAFVNKYGFGKGSFNIKKNHAHVLVEIEYF
jgi:hypothetical protein